MADIRFLSYPRFQAFDDNGKPLSGGKVNVYTAGTTNRIDTWTDFDKTSKNANPVILDSRGEADIFFDKSAKIVLTNSNDVTIWTLDNVEPLTSQTVTGKYNLVDNGSFELDGDGDNVPDNWNTTSSTSTATIEIDTTTVAHGTNSFKFASAGAGAGTATTANKFPVPDGDNVGVSFFVSSNNTTATNKVDLIFYDSSGGNTSTTNVWTGSGTQPSSLTLKSFGVSVPAGKTQADVKLTGVSNSETATTYFDHVQVLSQSYLFTGSPGEVTADASDLNKLDGATLEVSNVSATATEVNVLDGYTGNTTDLNNSLVGTLESVVDATNGGNNDQTEVSFTGISSDAHEIVVMLDSLSSDGTGTLQLQIGDSGGYETTGYRSMSVGGTGSTDSGSTSTASFHFQGNIQGGLYSGTMRLNLLDQSNNKWVQDNIISDSDTGIRKFGSGSKSLSSTLDRIRLKTDNGDNFDSGDVNILVKDA